MIQARHSTVSTKMMRFSLVPWCQQEVYDEKNNILYCDGCDVPFHQVYLRHSPYFAFQRLRHTGAGCEKLSHGQFLTKFKLCIIEPCPCALFVSQQHCYNVMSIPQGDWYCDYCRYAGCPSLMETTNAEHLILLRLHLAPPLIFHVYQCAESIAGGQ